MPPIEVGGKKSLIIKISSWGPMRRGSEKVGAKGGKV